MRDAVTFLNYWPLPVAALTSGALIVSTVTEKFDMPEWLLDAFVAAPEEPEPPNPSPVPETKLPLPYAPVPGRDDRTPLAYVPHVFGIGDPDLPNKLTGVGPTYWTHSGRGTGALIAPDIVLTTAHLFAKDGQRKGPFGRTNKAPTASDGQIYLEACGQAYTFKAIHLGSLSPRALLGLDYAIVELSAPACAEATILPIALTPDDLQCAEDQVFLNIGSCEFSDIARYADHPFFGDKAATNNAQERQAVFGVRCQPTGRSDTGDVSDGSTAVIVTKGCDGVPGGSGGPTVLSRDGGASDSVVGVANSYRPNTVYNNYTRIEGALAKHLANFVDLIELPASPAGTTVPSDIDPSTALGPWIAMTEQEAPE